MQRYDEYFNFPSAALLNIPKKSLIVAVEMLYFRLAVSLFVLFANSFCGCNLFVATYGAGGYHGILEPLLVCRPAAVQALHHFVV